jgi:hypothetical protein
MVLPATTSRRCSLVLVLAVAGGIVRAQPQRAEPVAFGDIDGDGRRDAALVVERPRHDGLAEVHVAVFAERRSGWRAVAAVRLDDGAEVERLRIVTGRLTAAYRRHYPVDPPGRPSNETVRSWAFVDGALLGGTAAAPHPRWRRAAENRLPR